MEIVEAYEFLKQKLKNSMIQKDEPMRKHTSFQIGGNADIYIKAKEIEDVKEVLLFAKENNIPLTVLGNGSNVLIKEKGIRGIVLSIGLDQYEIQKQQEKVFVTVQSGVKLGFLAQQLLKEEIAGFEFASGIPGTIGGAIRMNAGAHGKEMKDIVIHTTYLNENGEITILSNEEQQFSYRNSIFGNLPGVILQTTLELEHGKKEKIQDEMNEYASYRKEKQPITKPSAGSTFKRGDGYITAKLIDACGLKGYQIGGAKVSELHAGFVINEQNATADDVLKLIEYMKEKVYEKFQIKIELEIQVLGE